MDRIFLSGLRANPVIGVYPAERTRRQAVVIDVEIGLDLSRAAAGDGAPFCEKRFFCAFRP